MTLHEKIVAEAKEERKHDKDAREVYEVSHMTLADEEPKCDVCKDSGWLPRLGNFGEEIPCTCERGKRREQEQAAYHEHRAHARHTDPETSHQAAASVKDLTKSQKAIHEALQVIGEKGATDVTLIEFYNQHRHNYPHWPRLSDSGIRTRRKELSAQDPAKVVDTGRKERLPSGRNAIVWRAR